MSVEQTEVMALQLNSVMASFNITIFAGDDLDYIEVQDFEKANDENEDYIRVVAFLSSLLILIFLSGIIGYILHTPLFP